MRDRKLATRYARALLGALPDAVAQNQADAFLSSLGDAMRSNSELRAFLLDPAHTASAKQAIFATLGASRQIPQRVITFLEVVLSHGRVSQIPSIAEVFHTEREAAQGTVSATLTTASPMTPAMESRATAALEKLAGRKVNLKTQIDPALLGGAVATVGSMVYDGSLKTQLVRLRRSMGED
jgi:F-type H+-transporting ATPase subunit delta